MIRTIEATIDKKGHVNLSEPVKLTSSCRALVGGKTINTCE